MSEDLPDKPVILKSDNDFAVAYRDRVFPHLIREAAELLAEFLTDGRTAMMEDGTLYSFSTLDRDWLQALFDESSARRTISVN